MRLGRRREVVFFGREGDTRWVKALLRETLSEHEHVALDIRDREGVLDLVEDYRPDLIIHTAAQPSHDKAAHVPFLDFEVNALGNPGPSNDLKLDGWTF